MSPFLEGSYWGCFLARCTVDSLELGLGIRLLKFNLSRLHCASLVIMCRRSMDLHYDSHSRSLNPESPQYSSVLFFSERPQYTQSSVVSGAVAQTENDASFFSPSPGAPSSQEKENTLLLIPLQPETQVVSDSISDSKIAKLWNSSLVFRTSAECALYNSQWMKDLTVSQSRRLVWRLVVVAKDLIKCSMAKSVKGLQKDWMNRARYPEPITQGWIIFWWIDHLVRNITGAATNNMTSSRADLVASTPRMDKYAVSVVYKGSEVRPAQMELNAKSNPRIYLNLTAGAGWRMKQEAQW